MAKKKATAKKAARKSSPVKGKSVAWYIGTLGDWRADVVGALDELLRKTAPKATSGIKWAQPVYELGGPFCFLKAAKGHVTIGFWRGVELDDPQSLLEGSGDKMRHVKIRENDRIPTAELRKMIRQAVKLNQELGNPTR